MDSATHKTIKHDYVHTSNDIIVELRAVFSLLAYIGKKVNHLERHQCICLFSQNWNYDICTVVQ